MANNNYQIKNVGKSEKALDYVLVVFCLLLIVMTVYPFLNVLAISLNDPMDTMRNIYTYLKKTIWAVHLSCL